MRVVPSPQETRNLLKRKGRKFYYVSIVWSMHKEKVVQARQLPRDQNKDHVNNLVIPTDKSQVDLELNLCHTCLDFIIPSWSFKNCHFSRRCQCYLIYINILIWHINKKGQGNRDTKKHIRKGPHGVFCRLVIYPSEPKSSPLSHVHTKKRRAQADSEKFLWVLGLHSRTWKVR